MKVKDIFNISPEYSKSFSLIAGKGGLSNQINSVTIMEVPDGMYWVKKNDFIISTGYSISRKDVSLIYAIQTLIDRKAAGFGLKIGRFIDEIPDNVIDLCNTNNFPLICIDNKLSYPEIINPINNFLNSNNKKFEFTLQDKLLYDINNNSESIENLISILRKFSNKEIFIINNNMYQQIFSNETAINKIFKDYFVEIQETNGFFEINLNDKEYSILKIDLNNSSSSFLVIASDKSKLLSISKKNQIMNNLSLLSIYISKTSSSFKPVDKMYPDLLTKLINNENSIDKNTFEISIKKFNLNKNLSRLVIAINTILLNDYEKINLINDIKKALNITEEYYIYKNENNVIIISKNDGNFFQKFEFLKNYNVNVGLSNKCENLYYINLALEEALFAITLGPILEANKSIHYYYNLNIYHLAFQLMNHPAMILNYKNTIKRLIDYDYQNNTELLKTLQVLIDNNFNITKTSKDLFIHRNTLYKRINRIKNIVNINFYNDSKIIISLCYKLYEILKASSEFSYK